MTNVDYRYPFEMFVELRRDVAIVCRAFDEGRLSAADKDMLQLALDGLSRMSRNSEEMAMAVAIIGSIALMLAS
jgi:hypothetical protein